MFNGKMKALTFSYDDGITQDIRFIELLDKYGLKATFNINSELLGKPGSLNVSGVKVNHTKVPADKVAEIYQNHEIAVHTLTHPRLKELEKDELIRQVEQDRVNLSALVGYEVVGMASPFGDDSEYIAETIRENTGVRYSRTTIGSNNFEPQENLYRFSPTIYHLFWDDMMKLGKEFVELKADKPQIFYVWGHTYELDIDPENWNRIEEFMKLVSGKDDIFYGTNREILLK